MKRPEPNRRCDGVLRRDALRVGGLTAFGLSLNQWFQQRAIAGQREAAADSCILIWLDGGPSHLETFDLKPNAPQEVRGPFQPIATSVAGIQISEHLERTASVMEQLAILRSMTSPLGEHNFASHYLLTGYQPSPALAYPGMPSVMTHVHGAATAIPNNVAVQRPNPMAGRGYLGSSTSPFVVDGDPSRPGFRVKDLTASVALSPERMVRRRAYREQIDQMAVQATTSGADASFEQAYRLIASPEAREAFDLDREREAIRSRYGRHQLGQSCLMARRLIEAGTKFVTVTDRGWDTHDNLFTRLREGFTGGTAGKIPKLDVALSALIGDLDERGLLNSTLVLVMGEFGRTPKLNPRGGRDHWPRAFSVALAGGGIRGGQVVGQSDSHGERPADRPISPADLVRTVYQQLGIDGDLELNTDDGRPVQINRDGTLINELIS